MKKFILSIDQGTSGTKAVIFDEHGNIICKHTQPLRSYYPQTGFVEQDPLEIYDTVINAARQCYADFKQKYSEENYNLTCCGISNQRETFVLWDSEGKPLYNAVVWQCKRSVSICSELENKGFQKKINEKTGLLIDPYFSASKMIWIYQNNKEIQQKTNSGEVYFGTVDCWLLYKLTYGKEFATDHTNASRTLFYNIYELRWDEELLKMYGLEGLNLPEVKPSANYYGESYFEGIFSEELPITGMVGDSHAAYFGEECYEQDMAKATLGTGSSILWNAGDNPKKGEDSIVTTIGWSTSEGVSYAYEGLIVSAGSTLEWLRNQLSVFSNHSEIESMTTELIDNEGVYLIPAFSGMGAPYWKKEWKASIHGLTFGTSRNHLVRAGLESIAYQIKDVVNAIETEKGRSLKELKVDGGMTGNKFLLQLLANLLEVNIVNVGIQNVSAYGACLLAGLGSKVWDDTSLLPKRIEVDNKIFKPLKKPETHNLNLRYSTWRLLLDNKKY